MTKLFIDPQRADSDEGPPVLVRFAEAGTVHAAGRHAHRRGQLLGALQGLLSIETEVGRWVVPASHAVWLPPHQQHELLAHGPFRGWSVYVTQEACAALPDRPRVIRISGLLREAARRGAAWRTDRLDGPQARVAAVILDEIEAAGSEPFGLSMPRDPRLYRIAQAFLKDLTDSRRLEDWASWAAIPARTLSRRFGIETGFSFSEWRQRARLMHALELLATGASVTSVALDVGYDNLSAFIAVFRRTFGVTPARYLSAQG